MKTTIISLQTKHVGNDNNNQQNHTKGQTLCVMTSLEMSLVGYSPWHGVTKSWT